MRRIHDGAGSSPRPPELVAILSPCGEVGTFADEEPTAKRQSFPLNFRTPKHSAQTALAERHDRSIIAISPSIKASCRTQQPAECSRPRAPTAVSANRAARGSFQLSKESHRNRIPSEPSRSFSPRTRRATTCRIPPLSQNDLDSPYHRRTPRLTQSHQTRCITSLVPRLRMARLSYAASPE